MKHPYLTSTLGVVLAAGLLFTGCNKGPGGLSSSSSLKSAEPTSFAQVTKQLDPGGNLYLYLSTEQFLQGLAGKVANLRQLTEALPNLQDNDRANLGRAVDIVTNLITASGLQEISGFGMSSIATEKQFYHTKMLLHHYPGQGKGFLWAMFGQKPHELEGLRLLPTHTALAAFSDADLPLVWSVIQKQAGQSGFPQADEWLGRWPGLFEQFTGLKWDQALNSLGGEFGIVVTLDEGHMITLPIPGGNSPLEIPEPALMLVAKVNDDTIFNRIETALTKVGQMVVTNDTAGVKMRTVPVPLPLPIQLRPTVATSEGYLFIATSDALIRDALATRSGKKPGLRSTDEFQHLAKDMPQQGNQFSFVSQRLGQTFLTVQSQALERIPDGGKAEALQSLFKSAHAGFGFSVSANTDEGWLSVCNGNEHAAKVLVAGAVVPVAVASAIAIPAIAKLKARAQHGQDSGQ